MGFNESLGACEFRIRNPSASPPLACNRLLYLRAFLELRDLVRHRRPCRTEAVKNTVAEVHTARGSLSRKSTRRKSVAEVHTARLPLATATLALALAALSLRP